jgi:hypothetical protein
LIASCNDLASYKTHAPADEQLNTLRHDDPAA